MTREEALAEARRLICEDRAAEYGDAAPMAEALAARWSQWMGAPVAPWQVMGMLADLKLCRLARAGYAPDSGLDLIGYGALMIETSEER